ncbi:hypothetical protein LRAMOSA10995 [Lichtheimia ramosa]|uniref:GXWXG domain-containing protein n=1 Tax=Lichtheimia ramosa TaxID=688394 RepID=A0A077WQI5_9FUNG|nr:hypothetical protein LRAMOSA10995 [Lichtheimia ramosa]
MSAEQQVLTLTTGQYGARNEVLEALFNQLKPISSDFLLGEWDGGIFISAHPAGMALERINWAGKTFHSTEQVQPVIVHGEQPGERVWCKEYGLARIRQIEFRGVVSAAMVYDDKPIIDYFRFVDEQTVMGTMDVRPEAVGEVPESSEMFYFYLTRVKKQKND